MVEYSFVLKIRSIAGSYELTRILRNPKLTWDVVGIYRAPNEDMRVVERLVGRTGFTGNSTKSNTIGGD